MSEQKKLSNKELKELKKKEKAARRAAQKEVDGKPPGENPNAPAPSGGDKPQQQQQQQKQKSKKQVSAPSTTQIKKSINKPVKASTVESKVPSAFSHLSTREQRTAKLPLNLLNIIHPKILELSGLCANYSIVGSIARCKAMLEVFKIVIMDYQTPENSMFSRSLTAYLSHQIDYLKNSRPLSVTMGNAIRWMKQEISVLPIDMAELDAKKEMAEKIDIYIKEKIEYTDKMIIKFASTHITENSTILTFGHSKVLEELFLHCYNEQNKKNITIIIIDSRPLFEGKTLLKNLIAKGLKNCKYYVITALSNVLEEIKIDYVFLGAHSMLSNGRLYSRVGTALISMMSYKRDIPILVCCESIKFSERIQLDSVTQNELGDYNNLMDFFTDSPKKKNFALESFIKQKQLESKPSKQQQTQKQKNTQSQKDQNFKLEIPGGDSDESPLKKDISNISNLKILNIMYDLTPAHYINKIITELGALPPSSVPVIIREYKTN
ncbi:translation initiation factor eIF2B subunit delta [Saccharomycopsis crataegensis]|uniref:Translation initiation factor eIF2B subunit delta n=1 Tax=Saccharomycopsis crataegensis TaxID=43959 RepID=A0AAV5QF94_9ASCO|nr:translation initiation factor eIF2B subunit delta [Saccharomycopsis crataegensis]